MHFCNLNTLFQRKSILRVVPWLHLLFDRGHCECFLHPPHNHQKCWVEPLQLLRSLHSNISLNLPFRLNTPPPKQPFARHDSTEAVGHLHICTPNIQPSLSFGFPPPVVRIHFYRYILNLAHQLLFFLSSWLCFGWAGLLCRCLVELIWKFRPCFFSL